MDRVMSKRCNDRSQPPGGCRLQITAAMARTGRAPAEPRREAAAARAPAQRLVPDKRIQRPPDRHRPQPPAPSTPARGPPHRRRARSPTVRPLGRGRLLAMPVRPLRRIRGLLPPDWRRRPRSRLTAPANRPGRLRTTNRQQRPIARRRCCRASIGRLTRSSRRRIDRSQDRSPPPTPFASGG